MKEGLTVHILVKNEEVFVASAIESALRLGDEVIIFDTGSTDKTVEIIKGFKSKKIRFFEKEQSSAQMLVDFRNEMQSLTRTKWFITIDGEEILFFSDPKSILEKLEKLPENIIRVELTIRDFVRDFSLVARDRVIGKIWRTGSIKFYGEYPFEFGAPVNKPNEALESFSTASLRSMVISYHMNYLRRSSKDSDVKVGRHWRKIPFPIMLFLGPYPKELKVKINIPLALLKLVYFNVVGLVHKFFHNKEKARNALSPSWKKSS